MNEFTKEELEYLHELIGSISIAGHPIDDEALESKIKSMIKNYCEHEKICFYFIEKQNLAVEQCVKCQVWGATTSDDNNE